MCSLGTSEILKRLKAMLPDAWPVFFRYRYPRPIQIQAIPHIARGESVLLSSPTASGKTEAVVAPLYQRHISFRREILSVVYVAPTKALVNDLYYRLKDYLEVTLPGIVCRYTGDHHEFSTPVGKFLLLTTPEALDSIQLMRPESLSSVRAIVIDEIHMLHGTARGQQLRFVIRRLQAACGPPKSTNDNFQVVGMTATLNEAEKVGELWVNGEVRLIPFDEPREIQMTCLSSKGDGNKVEGRHRAQAIAQWVAETEPQKVLIFGNTRNRTHVLAAELYEGLKGTRWPVHFHVGILSRSERDRVESAMRNEKFGVCVATSTLEVGIDIGSIDAIVLADPPFSVSAFLQRIGRGNRHSDICRVVAIYGTEQEKVIYHALLHCARRGLLDEVHEYDRPSVRFQQLLSLAWRGVRSHQPLTLKNLLQKTGGEDHADTLEDMLNTGILKDIGGALVPDDQLMDEGDQRLIHTVIAGGGGPLLIDGKTGEIMGTASSTENKAGAIFMGGKYQKANIGTDGHTYLESLIKEDRFQLVRLPALRGKWGLSRRLVWGMAELEGTNPHCWTMIGSRLITWGGARFNKLLVIILEHAYSLKGLISDDFGLDNVDPNKQMKPKEIQRLTNKFLATGGITAGTAQYFCEPSRYLSRLSPKLQEIEAINSVPFSSFLTWLEECES
jgi:ATP-dependent helicase Lhr and Lhr-like helicase